MSFIEAIKDILILEKEYKETKQNTCAVEEFLNGMMFFQNTPSINYQTTTQIIPLNGYVDPNVFSDGIDEIFVEDIRTEITYIFDYNEDFEAVKKMYSGQEYMMVHEHGFLYHSDAGLYCEINQDFTIRMCELDQSLNGLNILHEETQLYIKLKKH